MSCVRGRPVTRFGTRTMIGAERAPDNEIHWFPDRVVALTKAEADRHKKEYGRLLAEGDLRLRTAEEWIAQQQTGEKAAAEKAARKAAAAAAADPQLTESPAHDEAGSSDPPPSEDSAT